MNNNLIIFFVLKCITSNYKILYTSEYNIARLQFQL